MENVLDLEVKKMLRDIMEADDEQVMKWIADDTADGTWNIYMYVYLVTIDNIEGQS